MFFVFLPRRDPHQVPAPVIQKKKKNYAINWVKNQNLRIEKGLIKESMNLHYTVILLLLHPVSLTHKNNPQR